MSADPLPDPSRDSPPDYAVVPADTLAQPRRIPVARVGWARAFAAFQHRNYRLFFGGQAVSMVGTWLHMVAEGWLVYQLTNSAFLLGFVRFVHTIPITLLTLVGGAMADRVSKRRVLVVTQTLAMGLALILAGLVYFDLVRVWHVAVLGLVFGIVHAFDIPARQSFVVEMVGKDDLMNAIALNSSLFNGTRVIGPALAGLLIGLIGLTGCFLVNGLSFLAVIGAYLLMRVPPHRAPATQQSIWHANLEALRFVRGQRRIRTLLVLVMLAGVFGWPYTVLMPAFARDVLHIGATGFGYLMAANGLGALGGALTLAGLGDRVPRRWLIFGGLIGFAVFLLGFALSTNAWLSALLLAGSGWFLLVFFATANTLVQLDTPDGLRGRVMGIYALAFIGMSPLGSLLIGTLARWTSPPFAVGFEAVVCIVAALVVMRLVPPRRS